MCAHYHKGHSFTHEIFKLYIFSGNAIGFKAAMVSMQRGLHLKEMRKTSKLALKAAKGQQ